MKKSKRIFLLGLCSLLIMPSLFGCGNGAKEQETGNEIVDFTLLSDNAGDMEEMTPEADWNSDAGIEESDILTAQEESGNTENDNDKTEIAETPNPSDETINDNDITETSSSATGDYVPSEEDYCYQSSFGYEIRIPLSWEETVRIVETEEGTMFILTAAEEENYTGILFLIRPLALDALEDYEGIAYSEDYAVQVGDGFQVLRPVEECYDRDNPVVADDFEEKYNEIGDIVMTMQSIQ